MHKFLDDIVNVYPTIDIEGTGHGFSKPQHWGKPFDDAMDKLLAHRSAERGGGPPTYFASLGGY
jgi:hypothetical protein